MATGWGVEGVSRYLVEDLSASTHSLLKLSGRELKGELVAFLRADEVARAIFLGCDGESSQAEIVARIGAQGIRGGSAMGVSRHIEVLVHDKGLLIKSGKKGRSPIYRHTHVAKTLQIERAISK